MAKARQSSGALPYLRLVAIKKRSLRVAAVDKLTYLTICILVFCILCFVPFTAMAQAREALLFLGRAEYNCFAHAVVLDCIYY